MPSKPPVAFVEKIDTLCELAGISRDDMTASLVKNYQMSRRLVNRWFSGEPPAVRVQYRKKFSQYWLKEHGLKIHPKHFECDVVDFKKTFDSNKFVPTKKIEPLIGSYQIIRPNSNDEDRYVLEAMSIYMSSDGPINVMYSHTTKPSPDFAYRGSFGVASRYYFSLLDRNHENPEFQRAYRCITIYIGDGVRSEILSGIMLRGVTAATGNGLQAVAVPLIAIKSDTATDFSRPDFLSTSVKQMTRLHAGKQIVLGEVSIDRCPMLFEFCKNLFDGIMGLKRGLFDQNKIVLHTIIPSEMNKIDGLSFTNWRFAVESELNDTKLTDEPSLENASAAP